MKIDRVLLSEDEIKKKCAELGELISKDFSDEEVVFVCMLRGAVIFFSDLIRNISVDCQTDFIVASSYGNDTVTSGCLDIKKDLETDITGKNVVIVEDIVDSGITLSAIKKLLISRNPKTLKICSLLNKPSRRVCTADIDYCGFDIPDEFVVGYGLDYAQHYRQLPYIAVLTED